MPIDFIIYKNILRLKSYNMFSPELFPKIQENPTEKIYKIKNKKITSIYPNLFDK
jgi:hypothetical protein